MDVLLNRMLQGILYVLQTKNFSFFSLHLMYMCLTINDESIFCESAKITMPWTEVVIPSPTSK